MTTGLFAEIAVNARIFKQPQAIFTYLVPDELRPLIVPGMLVWVPLRRGRVQGLVLALQDGSVSNWESPPGASTAGYTVRLIVDIADPEVRVPVAQIALARWVSDYYRVPLWDAIALLLPPGVLQDALMTWRPSAAGIEADLGALPQRERETLYFLRRNGETSEQTLDDVLRSNTADLRRVLLSLTNRGFVRRGVELSRPAVRVRYERTVRMLLEPEQQVIVLAELARAPRQQALLQTLIARREALPAGEELPAQDLPLDRLRRLAEHGWIAIGQREMLRNPLDGSTVQRDMPPELTRQQAQALDPVLEALDHSAHGVFLLHGITGSGKTELYLRAIARAMRRGRQAIVLVPEIALTAQLVRRFAARFGDTVVVLHSGLSLGERYDTWRRLSRGEAGVVVGSRSTVFAPLPHLGLIVVDEEHDGSYKHAEGVRYHARDVALRLAEMTGSVVVLGSATPSLESYQATKDGDFQLRELTERVTGRGHHGSQSVPLPPVRVVDMRVELRSGNRSIFSRALQQALTRTLRAEQQALLFLNRRGVASIVLCRDCGHVVSCIRCSSPLVLHNVDLAPQADGRIEAEPRGAWDTILRCHTCGYRELPPVQCPNCWSSRIRHFGVGTQRVVEEMNLLFPEARVLRWDRDVTSRKGSHDRLLDSFTAHEADVLVGTQMIAKGLDLPLVTLVGIVSADTGLHLPDFRAGERSFQLLAQVAGRAGRRDLGGQVVLQSYTPEHYALQAAANHDYYAFFREEIAFRRDTSYPPFGRLVRFIYSSTKPASTQAAAEELGRRIEAEIARLGIEDAGVIGPASAFLERVRKRYRWHLILRAPDVQPILDALGPLPGWTIDVDPVSML